MKELTPLAEQILEKADELADEFGHTFICSQLILTATLLLACDEDGKHINLVELRKKLKLSNTTGKRALKIYKKNWL
jgi:hypothetical protein